MTGPMVSIIIPVYNGSDYMREAIDSALAQTYDNIEVIVVNDGSSDDGKTEKIALSYGDRIRYFSKENGGVSSALNLGIREMRGEFFSWLSHDDVYFPKKVELEIYSFQKYGDGDKLVLCEAELIDKDSRVIMGAKKIKGLSVGNNEWHKALECMLGMGSYNGCALLIPKSAFEGNLFDESLRFAQDAYMWMKIFLKKYSLIYINALGVSNRVHGGQLTQTGRLLFRKDSEKISIDIAPRLAAEEKYAQKLIFSYAYRNAVLGNAEVVENCKAASEKNRILNSGQKFKITMATVYGRIRPLIRKIYYRIFRKIKTKD